MTLAKADRPTVFILHTFAKILVKALLLSDAGRAMQRESGRGRHG